jgi:hypothetical protein
MRLSAALGALLLCGCQVYAVPDPVTCPDVREGTFNFAGNRVVDPNHDCFFSIPGTPYFQVTDPLPFTATISRVPGGNQAVVCKQVPHAVPIDGTYTGLNVVVWDEWSVSIGGCSCPTPEAATAGNCNCPPNSTTCSCPAILRQLIDGFLEPSPSGPGYSGFAGELVNTVRWPFDGPIPTEVCNCQETCSYSYTLAATVVGPR